jgi:hypothetical protein
MVRSVVRVLAVVAVALCSLSVSVGAQAADDPFLGTWKLNVERSVYIPGPRPPTDLVTLYHFAALEDGWTRFMLTSTNALGEPTILINTFKVDGQRRPVYDQNTLGRLLATGQETNVTRSYRRVDATTVEFTGYTDGVAGLPVVRALLPDGNTYTQTTRGTNAQGVAVNNVIVFERVR